MEKKAKEYLAITNWAEEDRPREKLLLKGKSALSDAELIGILLGSGSKEESAVDLAKRILNHAQNNLNELARLTVEELQKFKGIGEAKAIAIVSALELGRRRKDAEPLQRPHINSSKQTYELMRAELMDLKTEEFWVILLSRSNQVIRKKQIGSGGVSGTFVDPKLIFKAALEATASGIILVHNHPSGNVKPSQQDIQLTKNLKESGKLLTITVFDHVIFTDHGYYSFADEGLI